MRRFNILTQIVPLRLICIIGTCPAMPLWYKGRPFKDQFHKSGPQQIPGTVQCAFYDLGGEGISYHDTTPNNDGAKLNHTSLPIQGVQSSHCRPGVPEYTCYFRENEGADISYTKDFADFKRPNLVDPPMNQLYIGGAEDGEWTNYTVKVKTAGTYRIIALYANAANKLRFDIDGKPASVYKLPVVTGGMHTWNKVEIGEITFPQSGRHLLTFHYDTGNNFAYFEFILLKKK